MIVLEAMPQGEPASRDGTKVDAVVLAGARNEGPLKEVSDAPLEALIEVGGRPMLAHVLEALRQTGQVGTVAIVGPREELAAAGDWVRWDHIRFPGDAGSLPANLKLGLDSLATQRPVLVVTSDIPLITPEAVVHFLRACAQEEADVYYPIIRREDSEARYPGVTRTYARLREGEFTGGNLALLSPAMVARHGPVLERAMALRKNPLALARLFGFGLFVKFVLGRLSVLDVERRFEKAFQVRAQAVLTPYPEVGLDVDKPSDLALVRQIWTGERAV